MAQVSDYALCFGDESFKLTCSLLDFEEVHQHPEKHHRDSGPHVNTQALFGGVGDLWQREGESVSREGEDAVCHAFRVGVRDALDLAERLYSSQITETM